MNNKKIPLTPDNIRWAIDANSARLSRLKHRFNAQEAWIASKSDGCIHGPGTHPATLHRKYDDIMAAAHARCLAYSDRHGDDALALVEGNVIPVELKLAFISKNNLTVSAKGLLQFKGTKPKSLFTSIGAHYEIMHNAESKRRFTIYVLVDTDNCELIDMFSLDADTAYRLVTQYKDGRSRPKKDHKQKRCISLKTFMEEGTPYRPDDLELEGMDAWQNEVIHHVLVHKSATDNRPVRVANASSTFNSRSEAELFLRVSKLAHMIPHIQAA